MTKKESAYFLLKSHFSIYLTGEKSQEEKKDKREDRRKKVKKNNDKKKKRHTKRKKTDILKEKNQTEKLRAES